MARALESISPLQNFASLCWRFAGLTATPAERMGKALGASTGEHPKIDEELFAPVFAGGWEGGSVAGVCKTLGLAGAFALDAEPLKRLPVVYARHEPGSVVDQAWIVLRDGDQLHFGAPRWMNDNVADRLSPQDRPSPKHKVYWVALDRHEILAVARATQKDLHWMNDSAIASIALYGPKPGQPKATGPVAWIEELGRLLEEQEKAMAAAKAKIKASEGPSGAAKAESGSLPRSPRKAAGR